MPVAPTEDTTAGERALILYTSGTTKDPKGVVHTHAYTWAQRAQADALARRPRGRRRLVHRRNRLGEGDLERAPRPVVARRRGRAARGRLRPRGAALAPAASRRHGALPGADRVPDAREARHARRGAPPAAPPCGLGRRAPQPGGDRTLPGRARADRPRRLRADRELAARRERARYADPSGLDGTAHAGARRRRDRRDGSRLPARRRGRPRADRTAAHAVRRLLGRARGDRSGVQGRLVPHRRSGDARRGRLPLVRRPGGRRDRLSRVSHRPVRGRERAPRASCGRRERGRGRTRSRPRPDRQGVRRPPPRTRAEPAARGRAAGTRESSDRAVQVPARDRVRR